VKSERTLLNCRYAAVPTLQGFGEHLSEQPVHDRSPGLLTNPSARYRIRWSADKFVSFKAAKHHGVGIGNDH
jgi:hypothetical protein